VIKQHGQSLRDTPSPAVAIDLASSARRGNCFSRRVDHQRITADLKSSNPTIICRLMTKPLIRRIGAVLMVLTFVVGLPMQGIAFVSAATASPVPWAAATDLPTPDDCDGCVDQPIVGMSCPVVFCVGLSAICSDTRECSRIRPDQPSTWFQDAPAGLLVRPDPYPPRTSIQA
jgi:hypothetical protein